MDFPDLTGVFYAAIFGLIVAVVAVVGGGGWLIWFLVHHIQFV